MIGVSIIIPVVRKEKANECIKAIYENARMSCEHFEVLAVDDTDGIGCPKMVKMLTDMAKHDWVMFLGDDTLPQKGFMQAAIDKIKGLPEEWGMVGLNDGIHGDSFATHWMCHKNMLMLTGGEFFHTGYNHQFCDKELTDIAKEYDRFVFAAESIIKHDHPFVNGSEPDKHYKKVYNKKAYKEDRALYLKRRAERTGKDKKIALALPVTDATIPINFFKSFCMMDFPEVEMFFPKFGFHPGDIAKVRNDLVKRAIYEDCTHIVFMDTDQVYRTADIIPRLLEHDKDIVGGKVHRRYHPFEPILQRGGLHVPDDEILKGGLIPVDSTGAGCLAINLDVFVELDKPWFKTVTDEEGEVEVGEDVHFCRKAKKAGFEIFVDCDVKIGHLTTWEVDWETYEISKKLRGVT